MEWRDIPSLAALRAFECAARHGNFSVAARDLNVTHAAIAQHVRALEDHFGLPLMQRAGRGMAVTAEGQVLAAALGEAFGIVGTACRDLSDRTRARALRVALTPSFAANWLMPRIGGFWASHPDIPVELIPGMGLVDMRADGIDLAIRYGRGDWPGVASEPLIPAGHVAVAAPSLLTGRRIECLGDLAGVTWLMDGARSEERLWLRTNGVDLDQEKVTTLANGHLVREAAKAGLGVAVLPAPIAAGEVATGALVELCREDNSTTAYHILSRPGMVSPSRDTFVRWLRAEAKH